MILISAQARRGLRLNSSLGAALRRLVVVLVAAIPLSMVWVMLDWALTATLLVSLVVAALVGRLVICGWGGLVADPTHKPIRQLDTQLRASRRDGGAFSTVQLVYLQVKVVNLVAFALIGITRLHHLRALT